MSDYTVIGQATPLIDGRAKVTGAIRFTPDLTLPGMLHARLVPSLVAHADLRRIDTTAALAVPGVVAVLTARDLPDIAPDDRMRLLLARGRVMFAGQPIALVLATSEAAAADGVEQVRVEYEPLPAALTIEDAMAEGAALVWPEGAPDTSEKYRGTNICARRQHKRGDIDAGFAEAEVVIERMFTTPMVHQSSIETHGVLAQPDPLTGGMVLWSSTQAPFEVRQTVASVLGLPESDVRVTAAPVGGGFGGKFGLYEPLVALAARITGRPVRLVLTRLEEMLATNPAPACKIKARIGARRDGMLVAFQAEILLDTGCYPNWIPSLAGFLLGSFYRIPHLHITSIGVMTFKPSVGSYRAPSAPSMLFVIDSLVDEIARQLNLDPLDARLANVSQTGDPMADGRPWAAVGARQVLEALRAHPAWQNRESARAAGRGVGVAVGGWVGGTEPAAAACSLQRDGTVHVHVGSVDLTGTTTTFALMAAETFGVAAKDVRVITDDTQSAPYSGGTGGSKVTITTGAAVVLAAREARRQALEIAAQEFEAAVEDLEIVNGKAQVRGVPGKAINLAEIASKTMQFGGRYAPVAALGRHVNTADSPTICAQLAEVEVDRETGEARVCRLVIVQDVGRAINPLAIRGQMTGGATQGIGWALYEQLRYDDSGQLLTGSFMDYAVPNSLQAAPEMEAVIVEVPSEHGPFGVRGVGEAPVVLTAAAIANAIADATGARLTDLPMTAPRILAALKA